MVKAAGFRKNLHSAAVSLAFNDKFAVFPLVPGQKRPAVSGGLKAATSNLLQVHRWWNERPWNIGVATGKVSNLVVVDLDGAEATRWWKSQSYPSTRYVKTGKGFHLYYRYPEDSFDIRNSASKLAPNVDIRGEGGYVLAPPSLHPNGNLYSWQQDEAPITPFPSLLAEALHREPHPPVPEDFEPRRELGTSAYGAAVLSSACEAIISAPNGTRNDTLYRKSFLVGVYVAGGEIDEFEAASSLRQAAALNGLGYDEVERTVPKALKDARSAPKRAPV